jgi:hypothetical protein
MAASHRLIIEPELALLSIPGTANRVSVFTTEDLAPTAPSVMPNHRLTPTRLPIGTHLYLASVAVVGIAIVGSFFGSGLLLLAQPRGQIQTESGIHCRNTEIDALRSTSPAADTEDGASSSASVPSLGSMVGEMTITAPAQAAPPSESAPSLRALSVPALSSTADETTVAAPEQTAPPGEVAPSSRVVASVAPPRSGESDHLRKISRPPRSPSDKLYGNARAAGGRIRSAKPDRNHNPEEYAAGANQQEYDQLRATGPAEDLSSAPSR